MEDIITIPGSPCVVVSNSSEAQSAFENEPDIGKTLSDWTYNYNERHGRRITDILQIGVKKYDYINVNGL